MNAIDKELETRLDALPDVYPDYTRMTMYVLRRCGLVEKTLEMLKDSPDATTNDVTTFDCEYRGRIELYDGEGRRRPAELERLALTREMRGILADLKGKTFKSYECVAEEDRVGIRPDGMAGITLGQHAVHLFNRDFPFIVGGARVELSALHCERMTLRDDFCLPPDIPVHSYAVGERMTGVELVTERVKVGEGPQAVELAVDVAVAVRTAHAVYTFARESWASTGIAVTVSDGVELPYEVADCRAELIGLLGGEVTVGKATRKTTKLA